MTEDQCNACRYADYIAYDDGDMFCCTKDDDPSMPFYMDENTFCPCFEKDDGRYDIVEVDEDNGIAYVDWYTEAPGVELTTATQGEKE